METNIIESNEKTKVETATEQPAVPTMETNVMKNLEAQRLWGNYVFNLAKMWASSGIVPPLYQNTNNAYIAVDTAMRMGVSPLVVMQNLSVIKGKPSWAGQACITLINNCGKFRDAKPVYTGERGTDNRGCYFSAVRVSNGENVEGTEVTLKMATAEGWMSNSKWRNMPEQMLAYRAAAFFARIHCPETLMGLHTVEEVQDINKGGISALTEALKGGDEDNA